jgi:hypothetical protein
VALSAFVKLGAGARRCYCVLVVSSAFVKLGVGFGVRRCYGLLVALSAFVKLGVGIGARFAIVGQWLRARW